MVVLVKKSKKNVSEYFFFDIFRQHFPDPSSLTFTKTGPA